ncbi:gliding motility lipoprotein GldH [uncultured Acetobacteroides sp.]|uniref:gliding motility lipoprotein GldH n=1 Tax=uncultured Acetobacteroides sp. TaxID=1760811 RepID=UPI0029F531C6|nr:gliding motility lipoprotein GldH [uncultured Acetobacteroides sp.]
MKTIRNIALLVAGALLISLASCDKSRVYEQSKPLGALWSKDSLARFEVNIDDTLSTHSVYVTLRNASTYPYSNVYLFVTTVAPSGAFVRDTMECVLADESGRWLGKGFSKYWDGRFAMRKNVKFPEKGVYSFTIQQGMRLEELPGIHDVGIRIERVKSK